MTIFFFFNFLEDTSSICGATDTPISDFFPFHTVLAKNVEINTLAAPSCGVGAPVWEILDPSPHQETWIHFHPVFSKYYAK